MKEHKDPEVINTLWFLCALEDEFFMDIHVPMQLSMCSRYEQSFYIRNCACAKCTGKINMDSLGRVIFTLRKGNLSYHKNLSIKRLENHSD